MAIKTLSKIKNCYNTHNQDKHLANMNCIGELNPSQKNDLPHCSR